MDRFRDALPDDANRPQWERKGEGIAPLAPDTEVVESIHNHQYVVATPGCSGGVKWSLLPQKLPAHTWGPKL